MRRFFKKAVSILCAVSMVSATAVVAEPITAKAANPYLPLWEHVPDGEPHVFEDPDNPGEYRLYIYGSHDINKTSYCGTNQVLWSAPVDDLTNWRYDGVIFEHDNDGDGTYDNLYAPDVCEVEEDGEKVYYLYPNDTANFGIVAKSSRPDGPFEVCATNCQLYGDPAVFVDDDGRVYGYWGFENSYCGEINTEDMATIKGEIYDKTTTNIGSYNVTTQNADDDNEFRFYEASSMRKILGKYVFIYSRWTKDGEDGLPKNNSTLAYAYGDSPLGPFTYGGTIIDARAKNVDADGNPITAWFDGNTHGSLCEVNGQWYVFYHRQTNKMETCRQGMAEPVNIYMDGDKLVIEEAEMTSQGLEINGLDPYDVHSAGITCYLTGGSAYVEATYEENAYEEGIVYDNEEFHNPVVDIKDGTTVGFKYYNFDEAGADTKLQVAMTAFGRDAKVSVMLDSPYEGQGTEIGTFDIKTSDMRCKNVYTVDLADLSEVEGKHAVYFNFTSEFEQVIAKFHSLVFTEGDELLLTPETEEPYFGIIDRAKWTASSDPYNVENESGNTAMAFDDDLESRWSSCQIQAGNESFVLNMGNAWTFNEITLLGNADYARGYKISVSNDGEEYTEVTTGTCDDSANPYTTIKFDKQRAQYIKIEQTGVVDTTTWWSIYDMNVYYNDPDQLSKNGWTVSVSQNTEYAGTMIDGDTTRSDDTRWSSNAVQAGTEWVMVDIGSEQYIDEIDLLSYNDYARGYEVQVSLDGTNFATVATGEGTTADNPTQTIKFDVQKARYVKILQTKAIADYVYWSVYEMSFYCRTDELPTVTPTPAPEFVLNPDFEGVPADTMVPWYWGITDDTKGKIQAITDDVKSGTYALKGSDRMSSEIGLQQYIGLTNSTVYKLSVWMKTDYTDIVKANIRYDHGSDDVVATAVSKDGEWVQLEIVFKTRESGTVTQIVFNSQHTSSDLYIDNVVLTVSDEEPEYIPSSKPVPIPEEPKEFYVTAIKTDTEEGLKVGVDVQADEYEGILDTELTVEVYDADGALKATDKIDISAEAAECVTNYFVFEYASTDDMVTVSLKDKNSRELIAETNAGTVDVSGANPMLPLWEHVPDGEPYVFTEPSTGERRVYIYGSHDTFAYTYLHGLRDDIAEDSGVEYCGLDYVVYSAPADDLTNWRYDGICATARMRDGYDQYTSDDALFAPDVVEKDGTYYMYIAEQNGTKISVGKSDNPAGPFTDWKETCLGFDPAVLVDDDGRVYGYWGFCGSWGVELDPDDMATAIGETFNVLPGDDPQNFNFFEASSIRKIDGKYVLIWSRSYERDDETGIDAGNTGYLEYAVSDSPLSGYKRMGLVIANTGETVTLEDGTTTRSYPNANNHGGIVEVNPGEWWVVYHRRNDVFSTDSKSEYARQAMIDRIEVATGANGELYIGKVIYDEDGNAIGQTEAEMTSSGAHLDGLDAYSRISAGYTYYMSDGVSASRSTYIASIFDLDAYENPKAWYSSPVVKITDGMNIGFRYLQFGTETPESVTVRAKADALADEAKVELKIGDPKAETQAVIDIPCDGKYHEITVPVTGEITGKQKVFFTFSSDKYCQFDWFTFEETQTPDPTPTPSVLPFVDVTEADPNFVWMGAPIQSVYEQGIMYGIDKTHFGPKLNITRADFAVTLYRIAGEPKVEYEDKFPDVADKLYYSNAIIWASKNGIVTGFKDGRYYPDAKISRQDMMSMLYRYAGKPVDKATGDYSHFTDANQVYDYAVNPVKWVIAEGLVSGNEDGTLAPQKNITRAEVAVILAQFVKNSAK